MFGLFGREKMASSETKVLTTTTPMHGEIFNAVVDLMHQNEWKFQQLEGGAAIRFVLNGEEIMIHTRVLIYEDDRLIIVLTKLPAAAPKERRIEAMKLISKINWLSSVGSLEIDMDDGYIHYKSSIDAEGTEVTAQTIKNIVDPCIHGMDRYGGAIMRVIFGGMSADEAFKLARADKDSDDE